MSKINCCIEKATSGSKEYFAFNLFKFTYFLLFVASMFIMFRVLTNHAWAQQNNSSQKRTDNRSIEEINFKKQFDISDEDIYKYEVVVKDSKGRPIQDAYVGTLGMNFTKNSLKDRFPKRFTPSQIIKRVQRSGQPIIFGDHRTNKDGVVEFNLWVYNDNLKKKYKRLPVEFYAEKEGYIDYGTGRTYPEKKSAVYITGSPQKTVRGKITLYKGVVYNIKIEGLETDIKSFNEKYTLTIEMYKNNGMIQFTENVKLSKAKCLVGITEPYSKPTFKKLDDGSYLKIFMDVSAAYADKEEKLKYLPIEKKITRSDLKNGSTYNLKLNNRKDK